MKLFVVELLNTQNDKNDFVKVEGLSPVDAALQFKGKRTVVGSREANIYEDDSKWCSCEKPDFENSTFFDDGEHEEIYKHHWRCSCGKILQIG